MDSLNNTEHGKRNTQSDWINYSQLLEYDLETETLSDLPGNQIIYQGVAAVANTGGKMQQWENLLSASEQKLLEVRRFIHLRDTGSAFQYLFALEQKREQLVDTPILEGDLHYLLAMAYHLEGNKYRTSLEMNKALKIYQHAKLQHRYYRAAINLAANLLKAHAISLLEEGRVLKAFSTALKASEYYSYDGCPIDRSINLILLAITSFLLGKIDQARNFAAKVLVTEGRVISYYKIYQSLEAHRLPKVPLGHPLWKTPWKRITLRPGSVLAKIVTQLQQQKRASRDQLITNVWGKEYIDQVSYHSRLQVSISKLKKIYQMGITFDGSCYQI